MTRREVGELIFCGACDMLGTGSGGILRYMVRRRFNETK